MKNLIIAAVFTAFFCSHALAECPDTTDFTPALLETTQKQTDLAARLIEPWNSDAKELTVTFNAIVTVNGAIDDLCCLMTPPEINEIAGDRLANRIRRLNFTPAVRDGRKEPVKVGFTIFAWKTDSGVKSALLLNHLLSAQEHGLTYIAPQRIDSDTLHANRLASDTSVKDYWGEVTARVDTKGNPSKTAVGRVDSGSRKEISRYAKRMQDECFIPGFVDGVPMELAYSEVISP